MTEESDDFVDTDGTAYTWDRVAGGYDITRPDGSYLLARENNAINLGLWHNPDGSADVPADVLHHDVTYLPTSLSTADYRRQQNDFEAMWSGRPGPAEAPRRAGRLGRWLGRG